jgi:hypothetical protein
VSRSPDRSGTSACASAKRRLPFICADGTCGREVIPGRFFCRPKSLWDFLSPFSCSQNTSKAPRRGLQQWLILQRVFTYPYVRRFDVAAPGTDALRLRRATFGWGA